MAKLFNESGGDLHDRRAEADKILAMIEGHEGRLSEKELGFIETCADPATVISGRMLFWLRDIKDKLL